MTIQLLFWMPLVAATIHIFEEFVWPGGFAQWYREYRPDISASISPQFLIGINALLLIVCAIAGASGATPRGTSLFLTIVALLAGNGLFHLRATIRAHRYSPGVISGVLLYVPLALVAFPVVLREGLASQGTALVSAAMGLSYPFVSSLNHRRRAALRS